MSTEHKLAGYAEPRILELLAGGASVITTLMRNPSNSNVVAIYIDAPTQATGQKSQEAETGCMERLADGQWWSYCGQTRIGAERALCTKCGGHFELNGKSTSGGQS